MHRKSFSQMRSVPVRLFTGTIRPLPESGRPTGMYKTPLLRETAVGPEGFAGDHQADRRVHGGPEKAVHLYPAGHYARLAERFPDAAEALVPGAIGENISADLDEAAVRVGDVWRLGTARLQICQPRNPCWKIDERFDSTGMAAFIVETRITGWYWRVIEPGAARPGDALELEHAATESPTLAEALELWRAHRDNREGLERLARMPGIASQWRHKIDQRLAWLEQQAAT